MSSGQPPRHVRNMAVVSGLYRWNTVEFPSEAWCTFLQGGYCRRRGHVAGGWLRHHRAGSPRTRPAHRQAAGSAVLTYADKRRVTRLQPHTGPRNFRLAANSGSIAATHYLTRRTIRRHHACFQRPVQTASVMIELLKGTCRSPAIEAASASSTGEHPEINLIRDLRRHSIGRFSRVTKGRTMMSMMSGTERDAS
jgi:hypothetical protein